MSDGMIMGVLGFIGALIVIVAPILRLNTNITKLNTMLDMFQEKYEADIKDMEGQLTTHDDQIRSLEKTATEHSIHIRNLEGKI